MKDILSRVADAMYCQIQNRGYAVPVDVLMDIGVLKKAKNDNRCAGRDPFLEAVCTDNLNKLSEMMKDMRDPLRLRAAGTHRSAAILLFWHVQKNVFRTGFLTVRQYFYAQNRPISTFYMRF